MILKYRIKDTWGFIDNVRQVANKSIDTQELIEEYDACPEFEGVELVDDIASFMNGEKLPHEITCSNKAFLMAVKSMIEEIDENRSHSENLLDGERIVQLYPATMILLYLNEHKEYDTVLMVTNQEAYLLNDNGKTIERLN